MTDTSKIDRLWRIGLPALLVARLLMSLLLMANVPRLMIHVGWYFYHGGDQDTYYNLARALADNAPQATTVGIGMPLLMAGLLRLTHAPDYFGILPALVILDGFVLGTLSVWVMAQLALALTLSRAQALAAAALWTFSPYLLWVALGLHREAEVLRNAYVPRQLWMNGLTDGPSLLLAMIGLWLVAARWRDGRARWMLLAGLCFGLGVTIRIHTMPIGAVAAVALLWNRRWKDAGWLILGGAVGFAPQMWYNALTMGGPLNTPYVSNWLRFGASGFKLNLRNTPFAPQYLLTNLWLLSRRNGLLAGAGAVAAAAAGWLFWQCWRTRGSLIALLTFGAPAASFALHVLTYIFTTDPIRFSLPAISIGVPGAVWSAVALKDIAARKLNSPKA